MNVIRGIFLSIVCLICASCGVKGDPQPLFREESPSRHHSAMGALPPSPEPSPSASTPVSE